MFLEDVFKEYDFHCVAKGYSPKTMKNKRQEYKQVLLFLKTKRGIDQLESVHTDDLRAYIRYKQQRGLMPQSIQTMAKAIMAFFNWCVQEEYLKESPMKKVELPKVPMKVLEGFNENEVYKMINAFDYSSYNEARNKAIIAMMADCGLRAMEIRTLPFKNVGETTILIHGKGSKDRVAFISPALKKILIKYERIRKEFVENKLLSEDTYFLSYKLQGLAHLSLDNIVKEAGKRADVNKKRISPHMFRHYFALTTLLNGCDIYSLSRLLGHSSLTVTQTYLQSLTDEKLGEQAKINSPLMNINKKRV
ncbi:tyrosine-type recombinase/integrase [Domibacillus epiphyticus]|uniref:Recombinase n=1 Tax=Domibacillus epiphyticus TaxID=1714355 RepID=A0A1V2A7T0_9BACI|nr:tyrosine-type recombinase/integrase [Domibacillus epiphyticus]OMP66874.1 recombinase [Domibacillus epiphyticus]